MLKLEDITRIFVKITLWWLIIIFVIFFNVKEVWIEYKWNTDLWLEQQNKSFKLTNISNSQIKKNKRKIHIISEKEKKYFLDKLVKNALMKVHWVWNKKETLDKLCKYYKKYCSIIDISKDEFNLSQQTYYTAITIYLLRYLSVTFPDLLQRLYYVKIQKDKVGRRWYAWHHSLVMNLKNWIWYEQFLEVLTHELWHIVDLGLIVWTSKEKSKKYTEFWRAVFSIDDKSLVFYRLSWESEKIKKPYSYAKDFVSWYWLTDTFEDFAECFNMYVNHNSVFRKMAKESNILKKKYLFINNIMHWRYLQSDSKFKYKIGFRPRDSTDFSK